MHLAADDQMPVPNRDARQRVVRVDVAPVVVRTAVVQIRRLQDARGGERIEPLAEAAVEVPVLVVAEDGAVAAGDGGGEGGGRAPGLHEHVRAEGEVEVEGDFFPHDGREVVGAEGAVEVVEEGLEERLQHAGGGGVDAGVEGVGYEVYFVAAGVEEGGEGGDAWEEVGVEGLEEGGDGGVVEAELAGGGLGRVVLPRRLLVVRCD